MAFETCRRGAVYCHSQHIRRKFPFYFVGKRVQSRDLARLRAPTPPAPARSATPAPVEMVLVIDRPEPEHLGVVDHLELLIFPHRDLADRESSGPCGLVATHNP